MNRLEVVPWSMALEEKRHTKAVSEVNEVAQWRIALILSEKTYPIN